MDERGSGSDEEQRVHDISEQGPAAAAEEGMGGFEGLEDSRPQKGLPEKPEVERELAYPEDSLEQLEGLQAELESLNDRHLRLAAEFDNYRKRANREREEIRLRGEADLVTKLLDPLDDLRRVSGVEQEATSVEALLEGIRLVEKKLRRVLESEGLEPIDPADEYFNPETMEALMTAPAEHPEEDDVVDQVFQPGYRFHGSLLRPARVRVKKYEE